MLTPDRFNRFHATAAAALKMNSRPSLWELFDIQRDSKDELNPTGTKYYPPPWYSASNNEIRNSIVALQENSEAIRESRDNLLEESFEETFAKAIFGSNAIEEAGLDLTETWKLCRKYFAGDITQDEEKLLNLPSKNSCSQQSRREVLQHIEAFIYIKGIVKREGQLTKEDLFMTHTILMKNIPSSQGFLGYEGGYRTCRMTVGKPLMTKDGEEVQVAEPEDVPKRMDKWFKLFNQLLKSTEDPILAASKLKLGFVAIHPFLDGNGRMSRILANTFISDHLPHTLITFGKDNKDRQNYQSSLRRSLRTRDAGFFAFHTLRNVCRNQEALLEKIKPIDNDGSSSSRRTLSTLQKIKERLRPITKKGTKILEKGKDAKNNLTTSLEQFSLH